MTAPDRQSSATLRLHRGEDAGTGWCELSASALRDLALSHATTDGHLLVLVDGGGGSGKTTCGRLLAQALGAPLVHTDDVAWHLDMFAWVDQLVEGVLDPWGRGEAVSYRPPGWVARGREGAIEVPPGRRLVVEGVGAGRAELAHRAQLVVWVQTDLDVAERRGLARDVAEGRHPDEAERFWHEWMRGELEMFDRERPWLRAHLVVDGTWPGLLTGGSVRAQVR